MITMFSILTPRLPLMGIISQLSSTQIKSGSASLCYALLMLGRSLFIVPRRPSLLSRPRVTAHVMPHMVGRSLVLLLLHRSGVKSYYPLLSSLGCICVDSGGDECGGAQRGGRP